MSIKRCSELIITHVELTPFITGAKKSLIKMSLLACMDFTKK